MKQSKFKCILGQYRRRLQSAIMKEKKCFINGLSAKNASETPFRIDCLGKNPKRAPRMGRANFLNIKDKSQALTISYKKEHSLTLILILLAHKNKAGYKAISNKLGYCVNRTKLKYQYQITKRKKIFSLFPLTLFKDDRAKKVEITEKRGLFKEIAQHTSDLGFNLNNNIASAFAPQPFVRLCPEREDENEDFSSSLSGGAFQKKEASSEGTEGGRGRPHKNRKTSYIMLNYVGTNRISRFFTQWINRLNPIGSPFRKHSNTKEIRVDSDLQSTFLKEKNQQFNTSSINDIIGSEIILVKYKLSIEGHFKNQKTRLLLSKNHLTSLATQVLYNYISFFDVNLQLFSKIPKEKLTHHFAPSAFAETKVKGARLNKTKRNHILGALVIFDTLHKTYFISDDELKQCSLNQTKTHFKFSEVFAFGKKALPFVLRRRMRAVQKKRPFNKFFFEQIKYESVLDYSSHYIKPKLELNIGLVGCFKMITNYALMSNIKKPLIKFLFLLKYKQRNVRFFN